MIKYKTPAGKIVEVEPMLRGTEGIFLHTPFPEPTLIFRVYTGDDFTDYHVRHSDLEVLILDEDAYIYKPSDGELYLDSGPDTLGLEKLEPDLEKKDISLTGDEKHSYDLFCALHFCPESNEALGTTATLSQSDTTGLGVNISATCDKCGAGQDITDYGSW